MAVKAMAAAIGPKSVAHARRELVFISPTPSLP
jgi:hypothetical protein